MNCHPVFPNLSSVVVDHASPLPPQHSIFRFIYHDLNGTPIVYPFDLDRKLQSLCRSRDNEVPNANRSANFENIRSFSFE